MRLVDATKLERIWESQKARDQYNGGGYLYSPQDILDDIEDAETIDAVPVVRCKDCKHLECSDDRSICLCLRKMIGIIRPDDFCSYGERKDGEG